MIPQLFTLVVQVREIATHPPFTQTSYAKVLLLAHLTRKTNEDSLFVLCVGHRAQGTLAYDEKLKGNGGERR